MSEAHGSTRETAAEPTILRVARWLLFATLLVPVVIVPGFFFPFVTTRAVFFRVLVEIAVALLLVLLLQRQLVTDFRRDMVLWALIAWVGANLLAAVLGVAFMRSFFGDHERMGGVWFWSHLVAYYVALRVAFRADDWWRFFRAALAVAVVMSGYGLLQYWLRPFPVAVGGVDAGSTVGNPGLMAGYLLAGVACGAVLAARARSLGRAAYLAAGFLLVTAMVFSGNRSSLLALFLGTGVALMAHAVWSRSFRGPAAIVAGVMLAIAVALPFVASMQSAGPVVARVPALARLSGGVDSSRVIQWRAAVDGIRDRPLVGVGPENYQIIWSRYYHPEMYRFLSDTRWDRAHNAYLDAFATVGILGFLSLLVVWLALALTTRIAARRPGTASGAMQGGARSGTESVVLGFFAAYFFYLFFWFYDLNAAMLWIALAAFVTTRATGGRLVELGAPRARRWQTTMVLGFGAIGLLGVLYVHGFETLRMARTLVRAGDPTRPMNETFSAFEAVFASPAPVTQHALLMYAGRLRNLYPRFGEIRSDPRRAAMFDRAFALAIKEFERQAVQDPLNERMLVQEARVLILGAYYYRDARFYDAALAKLHRAVALAPRRVNTHLVLGVAYLNTDRARQALAVFQTAYAVYPPHGQTHSYIAEAYSALDRPDSAALWLRSAVSQGYLPDRNFVERVAQRLAASGNARGAAELTWNYIRGRAGPVFLWSTGVAYPDPVNASLATAVADFFAAAGDTEREALVRAAAPALCVRPLPLLSMATATIGRVPDRAATCVEPWRSANVF